MGGTDCSFALELNQRLGLAVQTDPPAWTPGSQPQACPALSTSSSPTQTPDPKLTKLEAAPARSGEGSGEGRLGAGGHARRKGSQECTPGCVWPGAHMGLCSVPLKRSDAEH